jgi:hypothetical protein
MRHGDLTMTNSAKLFGTATGDMRNVQPFHVCLNLHVPGKGYSLSIHTEHAEMQVYVSEKGRVIRAYEPRTKQKRDTTAEVAA